ncbi:hypothetical protein JRI60_18630 [Archangium violaceum]|uniref:hypothetical protein n=1 Tax=Archangium violaceum TaxID=83451 RepID=UPI001950138F|nr:hypothetical protein [Archangium violaceum]QRO00899.1 hypothetical protein JRI60_18630 [Archangium violaceum]
MTMFLRRWPLAFVVVTGLLSGCGLPEEEGLTEPVGSTELELTNTCQSLSQHYAFKCATIPVYSSATSSTAIDTIYCGGANVSVRLLKACPSNERFYVEYSRLSGPYEPGWVHRSFIATVN